MEKLPPEIERANAIYSEGFRARLRGINTNPYPVGTPDFESWSLGWEDQDEHLRTRDECLAQIGWFGNPEPVSRH